MPAGGVVPHVPSPTGSLATTPSPATRPAGKLKVSIKAGWLKDAPIDADAMSEGSGFTGISGDGGFAPSGGGGSLPPHAGRGGEEQDLSGFEAASGGSVLGEGPLQRKSFLGDSGRSAVGGPRPGGVAGAAHASGGAATRGHDRGAGGVPRPESSAGSATGSPRIPALGGSVGRGRRGSAAAAGEIPPFEPPLSAEQQRAEIERQKAAVMVAAQEQVRWGLQGVVASRVHQVMVLRRMPARRVVSMMPQ